MFATTSAAVIWQQDTITGPSVHLLMIFIGIAAFALLAQACVMLGMAFGAAKAQKQIMGHIESLSAKVTPLLEKSTILVNDLTPQIREIAGHAQVISARAEEISGLVREKVYELTPTIDAANETIREANGTVRVANERTREQVERVNGMVSSVLDATAQAGRAIQNGVATPVREVSNIIEGLKVGILTFINGEVRPRR